MARAGVYAVSRWWVVRTRFGRGTSRPCHLVVCCPAQTVILGNPCSSLCHVAHPAALCSEPGLTPDQLAHQDSPPCVSECSLWFALLQPGCAVRDEPGLCQEVYLAQVRRPGVSLQGARPQQPGTTACHTATFPLAPRAFCVAAGNAAGGVQRSAAGLSLGAAVLYVSTSAFCFRCASMCTLARCISEAQVRQGCWGRERPLLPLYSI